VTTRVYLLRHGETEWNRHGNRYCGRTDVPLSENGRAQARTAANTLAEVSFAAIYASTLRRSGETAQIIAAHREIGVQREAGLVEIDFGAFEGKTPVEMELEMADLWRDWRADPAATRAGGTGETGAEATNRIAAAIEAIRLRHPGQTILIVGHNSINRLWIADFLGMPVKNYQRLTQANTGITIVDLGDGENRLLQLNVPPGMAPSVPL
jgi:broad specificity phosphatase PhoE